MELFDKPNPITTLDIVLPKNLFYVGIAIELTLELINVFIACSLTHPALLSWGYFSATLILSAFCASSSLIFTVSSMPLTIAEFTFFNAVSMAVLIE